MMVPSVNRSPLPTAFVVKLASSVRVADSRFTPEVFGPSPELPSAEAQMLQFHSPQFSAGPNLDHRLPRHDARLWTMQRVTLITLSLLLFLCLSLFLVAFFGFSSFTRQIRGRDDMVPCANVGNLSSMGSSSMELRRWSHGWRLRSFLPSIGGRRDGD